MITIAVLLTVYNRKEVTLKGLQSLYASIDNLGGGYHFDVYMTDDGSTDGTAEAVKTEYPNINIIQGNGNLYWSGGMRKAWQTAIKSGIHYDFYLWFNDDAELFNNALAIIFESQAKFGDQCIISGAFYDSDGKTSYGGKSQDCNWINPGDCQQVFYMNGNFVLIPDNVYKTLGTIDQIFIHGLGDWDYGMRALEKGFDVKVSTKYVGMTNRHDEQIIELWNYDLKLKERLRKFYGPKHSPTIQFRFDKRHLGLRYAITRFIVYHIYTLFPFVYKALH